MEQLKLIDFKILILRLHKQALGKQFSRFNVYV